MTRKPLSAKKVRRPKKIYSLATDEEKVARNWNKACSLFKAGEYSVSILRCATCIELAVNFVIRQELITKRTLPIEFVDTLLKNANGVHNKFQNLYLPIMIQNEGHAALKTLWEKQIKKINEERNKVAHQGEFRNKKAGQEIMELTSTALAELMRPYGIGPLRRFLP